MDGTCRHVLASFSTPRISRQSSQVDEWTSSRSARWNRHVQRENVRFQGWSLTRAPNVAPFLAHHRTRLLDWKLIASTLRIKNYNHAKVGNWFCPSNFIGVCHLRDVSDAAGTLNRNENSTIRVHYRQKDISQNEGLSNLEYEILNFMERSEKPFSFPTKSELLKAGRADLVDAVLETGGWLVAGWDVELQGTEKVQTHTAAGTESISKQISGMLVELPNLLTGDNNSVYKAMLMKGRNNQKSSILPSGFKEPVTSYPATARSQDKFALNLSNRGTSSGELPRSADLKRGWEEVSKLFGLSSSKRKPEHDRKTVEEDYPGSVKEGDYISTSVPKANTSVAADNPSTHLLKNRPDSFLEKTDIPPSKQNYVPENFAHGNLGRERLCSGENQSINLVSHVKSRKKKRRKCLENRSEDGKVNQVFKRMNEKVTRRNDWVVMLNSSSHEKPYEPQKDDPVPISSLIGCLESELTATLNMLQTGRHLLNRDDTMREMDNTPLYEIEKASDALEFCETDLMRKRADLRTKRAQLAALKGKLAFDLMEAQREMEWKDERLNKAMNILKTMRTVRIVWPNPASEVFVTGSFDGWTSQIKLQKSNAGVFVTALQLYPGRYEIKFIVDGTWRVDPDRPIIHHDGFENNLLTILKKHI